MTNPTPGTRDPLIKEVLKSYIMITSEEAETTVDSSHEAFVTWNEKRADVISAIATELRERKEESVNANSIAVGL